MNNVNEEIVLLGGGGGVYRVARFLKHRRKNITTIQTMFDHGGHSGKLRDERGALPPGDIRQAILALADDEGEGALRTLLSYRFSHNGSSIDNATMGNLMLTALTEHYGDHIAAIEAMCRIFRVKGKVLPVSIDHADLCVTLSDGSTICGEGKIDTRSARDDRRIVSARLSPKANIYVGAYEAIVRADKIVFCPGDLFTSVIPITLVDGFADAIEKTSAKLVYIVNLMTKHAETPQFTASRFARTTLSHIGRDRFHTIIANTSDILPDIRKRYRKERSHPVRVDMDQLQRVADVVLTGNIADQSGEVLRHNSNIATLICNL